MRKQKKIEKNKQYNLEPVIKPATEDEPRMTTRMLIQFLGFILLTAIAYMLLLSVCAGCAMKSHMDQPIRPLPPVLQNAGFEGDIKIAQMSQQDCNSQSAYAEKVIKYLLQLKNLPPATTIDVEPRPGSSLCGGMQGMTNLVVLPTLGARNIGVFRIVLRWRSITLRDHARVQKLLWSMAPTK